MERTIFSMGGVRGIDPHPSIRPYFVIEHKSAPLIEGHEGQLDQLIICFTI